MNKPVFEMSDLELKSIAYDLLRDIKTFQKNVDLIEMELERRRNNVLTTMSQEQFNNAIQK